MRKALLLILLSLPLVAAAQPKKNWLKPLHSAPEAGAVHSSVLRTIAQTNLTAARHPQAISNLLLHPTPQRPVTPKLNTNLVLTPQQRKDWIASYHQTLQDFEQLKKEINAFLFYQSIPLEAREISTQEKRYWLEKMLPLHHKLLSLYLNTQAEESLQYALAYLYYGVETVDPSFTALLSEEIKPFMPPFDPQAFFLYPTDTPLPDPSIQLDGKHILILNDDFSLLRHFDYLAKMGLLFPGATLHTQGDALQFLLWLGYTHIQPDLIFTDIQLGENNGYFVAHELRRRGYTGGIIALTSYTETEKYARQLKTAGFDGLVSLDDRYYGKIPFCQRVTQAAQLYFLQSEKE